MYMDRPSAPTAYVAEDNVLGHQRKEKPFGFITRFNSQFMGMSRGSKGSFRGIGWGLLRDLMDRKLERDRTFLKKI